MLLWTTDPTNHKGELFPVVGAGEISCEVKKGHGEQILGGGVKEEREGGRGEEILGLTCQYCEYKASPNIIQAQSWAEFNQSIVPPCNVEV